MTVDNGVSLDINGATVSFSSLEKLIGFLNDERASVSWLKESNFQMSMELFRNLYSKPIQDLISNLPNNEQSGGIVGQLGNTKWQFINSISRNGRIVQTAREEYGDIVATFVLYYLSNDKRLQLGNATARSLTDPALERERSLGAFIAHSSLDIQSLKIRSGIDLTKKLLIQLKKESKATLESMELSRSQATTLARKIQTDADDDAAKRMRRFKNRIDRYRALAEKIKEQSNKTLTDTQDTLESARTAYHDNVDLQASVSYWSDRRTEHRKAKRNWLIGVIFGMCIMFTATAFYYGKGGISHFFLVEPEFVVSATEGDSKTSDASRVLAAPSFRKEESSEERIARLAADMIGALIMLTIFGTLIRLGLRQFNVHSQLELDSIEKVTLTKTYLALLGENKLNSSEDRRLVLEGIFRPSNPAIAAAEAAFSTPIELILKSMKPNAP